MSHAHDTAGDIETMERAKAEHHVAEMTLSREQMGIFAHDLERLSRQVAHILSALGGESALRSIRSLSNRVGSMEHRLASSLPEQERLIRELRQGHEDLVLVHGTAPDRIAALERSVGSGASASAGSRPDLLAQRVDSLERALAEATQKHAAALSGLQQSQLRQARDLEEARAAASHHSALQDRLQRLEGCLGDPAGLQRAVELSGVLEGQVREHARTLAEVRRSHDSSLADRLAYLERAVEEGAGSHARLAADHASVRDRHARDISEHRSGHLSTSERLASLESDAGEAERRQAAALAELAGRCEEQLRGVEAACEQQLQRLEGGCDEQLRRLGTVPQRVASLERHLGVPAEGAAHGVEQAAPQPVDPAVLGSTGAAGVSADVFLPWGGHSSSASASAGAVCRAASIAERLAFLEREFGVPAACGGHSGGAASVATAAAASSSAAAAVAAGSSSPAPRGSSSAAAAVAAGSSSTAPRSGEATSLATRVLLLEQGVGESAARHQRYMEENNKVLDEYHGHHTAIEDRVSYLEQSSETAAAKQQDDVAEVRRLCEELRCHLGDPAALEDRLGALERQHLKDARVLELFADCLRVELRSKSELLDRVLGSVDSGAARGGEAAGGSPTPGLGLRSGGDASAGSPLVSALGADGVGL